MENVTMCKEENIVDEEMCSYNPKRVVDACLYGEFCYTFFVYFSYIG